MSKSLKIRGAQLAAAGLLGLGAIAGTSALEVVTAPPAAAITVTGTVPNRIVYVYSCSRWTGNCHFQYSYQSNGAYNPSVPTVYVSQINWTWTWF
jgi:hypothetical protein